MKKLLSLSLLWIGNLYSQMPNTDIFLAEIDISAGIVKIKNSTNITSRPGYDNQPFFTPGDKTILYSSESESDGKTHICEYNIKSKTNKRISITNTSEYSPKVMSDGKSFSTVLVEEDSTQRVWVFDIKSGSNKYCLSQQTDSVGYYTWFGKDTVLYYKLTNPHSLRALNIKTHQDNWLCDNPARSFGQVNAWQFFYVIHAEKENTIYLYDVRTRKASIYATDNNSTNQDYNWHPVLGLLKSEQSKIYRYSPDSKVWVETADFSSFGIKQITRFSFSNNSKYCCVVSNNN